MRFHRLDLPMRVIPGAAASNARACLPILVLAALVAFPRPVSAQASDTPLARDSSSTGAPAHQLAKRTRVSLDASVARLDNGATVSYTVAGSVVPFLGEHLEIGVAPNYTHADGPGSLSYQSTTTALVANYVFGGDPHWRGYVGAYGSLSKQTYSSSVRGSGVQGGMLYFLTPAAALRAELRYRSLSMPSKPSVGSDVAMVTLDPYVLGAADALTVTPAGLGTLDLGFTAYHVRYSSYHATGVYGTVAPFLTRWTQLGVEGGVERASDFGGVTSYRARGFGRGYVPLTVRTQPFVEAFAETNDYNGDNGGLRNYGGTLGVRRMLNANVALDVGARRTLQRAETIGTGPSRFTFRSPGSTSLVVGVLTRVGRAR